MTTVDEWFPCLYSDQQVFLSLFFLFSQPTLLGVGERSEGLCGCLAASWGQPITPTYAMSGKFQATRFLARPLHHAEPKLVAYSEFLQNVTEKTWKQWEGLGHISGNREQPSWDRFPWNKTGLSIILLIITATYGELKSSDGLRCNFASPTWIYLASLEAKQLTKWLVTTARP